MVRWLAGAMLTVAAAAGAAETNVRFTITGLPSLPAGSGPVKLTEVVRQMVVQGSARPTNTLEVRVPENQPVQVQERALQVSGPATFVSGTTVASF